MAVHQNKNMKLVSFENLSKYNELLNQKTVRSVNSVKPDSTGNVTLGTEKSTFNKVVYDIGYFSIGTDATYNFDLTGTDLENVSKENVNIRLVAKVITAHNGFEVGDIAQITPSVDDTATPGVTYDLCAYISGNTLYVYSSKHRNISILSRSRGWMLKANVQIKAVLTAFIPDDGSILLIAEDHNNISKLIGLPDGTLTWGGKTIAPITGKIEWFAFNTPLDGYLVCNGANVSRETYADLFAVIGTTFGSGDGSTTFTLPDLRDRYIIGANRNALGTQIAEQLPNIRGKFDPNITSLAPWLFYTGSTRTGAFADSPIKNFTQHPLVNVTGGNLIGGLDLNASNSNSVYTDNGHVYPLSLALLPCIKY